MSLADARARMGAQAERSRLLDRADMVIKNDGTIEDLAAEADRVWAELVRRRNARSAL
jgi:dephospho-CoA kinase